MTHLQAATSVKSVAATLLLPKAKKIVTFPEVLEVLMAPGTMNMAQVLTRVMGRRGRWP